jgi:hypothetical protein
MRRPVLTLLCVAVLAGLTAPATHAAASLGIPTDVSPLFSLTAEGGTLQKAKGKGRSRTTRSPATTSTDRPGTVRAVS